MFRITILKKFESFEYSNLEFVSNFDIRASRLPGVSEGSAAYYFYMENM
jgi:hypothetical protein